jgi:hypothetical protein
MGAKRRHTFLCTALAAVTLLVAAARAEDPLPSWNEGAAKKAIVDFVQATMTVSSAGAAEFSSRKLLATSRESLQRPPNASSQGR